MPSRRQPCNREWLKKLSPTAWPRFGDGHQSWGRGRQDPGIGKLPLKITPSEVSGCGWWEWGPVIKSGEQNRANVWVL